MNFKSTGTGAGGRNVMLDRIRWVGDWPEPCKTMAGKLSKIEDDPAGAHTGFGRILYVL